MFTIEDAKDDSTVKTEVAPDLIRTAKRSSPRIFKHFENVCENLDQDPRMVLADMLVRSLNDQGFAEGVLETEVTMEAISRGEYRKEDIEMVKEIAETFDLEPDTRDGGGSIVDRIIESRIEAVSTGPLDKFSGRRGGNGQVSGNGQVEELQSEIERLKAELDRVKSNNQSTAEVKKDSGNKSESEKKDIDELFDTETETEEETESEETEEQEEQEEYEEEGMEAGPTLGGETGEEEEEDEEFDPEVQ